MKEERRILIVDDDRESTRLLKILLEKIGYLVLEENDAAKAHQSFSSRLLINSGTISERFLDEL